MKKLTAQYRVIGGVFCLFFLNCIAQAQEGETLITTSEEPVVVIDSYEAALDENTKQSDLNIGEAVEPDFFNDIVDRIRGIFTSDDGSVEIGFLEGVFKSDTPALRIDQEGDAILQGDLTVRTVKSAGDLTVGSPEEVSNTEGKAITVGDKDRGVIELHGGDGQEIIAKGMVQMGDFGMEIGTLTNQVLKFFTNSTPRMSITTEGNVGIGETTTNPTARLEVGGDIKATDTITASSFIGDGSQLTGIEGKFVDGDTSTDAVFTTGNVGIGTTDPSTKLEVDGSVTASSLHVRRDGGDTYPNLGEFDFVGTSGVPHFHVKNSVGSSIVQQFRGIDSLGTSQYFNLHLSAAGKTFSLGGPAADKVNISGSVTATSFIGDGSQLTGLSAGGKFTDGTSATDAVFTAGNVGIGTTDPNNELVVGESRMNDVAGGDPAIEVGGDRAFISLGKSNTERVQLGWNNENSEGNQYADLTTVGSSPQPLVLQRGGGNVGIGTTDPREKLEVNEDAVRSSLDPNLDTGHTFFLRNSYENDTGIVSIGFGQRTSGAWSNSAIASISLSPGNPRLGFFTEYNNDRGDKKEKLSILNNGNVGIGTTDPRTQLQVAGEGDTSILISSTGPRYDRDAEIGFENDEILWKLSNDDSFGNKQGFHVYNHPRNADGTFDSASSVMYLEANGNVGIGTTDPLSYAGPNLDIQTGGLAINGQAITYYWPSSDTIGIGDVHSGDGLRDNLVLKTRDQDRLFINGSGNVGIGTTDPESKLEIYGDGSTVGSAAIRFNQPNGENGFSIGLGTTDNKLHIGDSWNPESGTHVTIEQSGNVGIGTTDPSAKLEVRGRIYMRNGFALNTTAADFYMGGEFDRKRGRALVAGGDSLIANYNNDFSRFDVHSNMTVSGSVTATSFLYSSDQNKKKDIQTLGSPLETIQNLRGVSFRWQENDEESIGFIAQEVEKVLPSLVSGEEGEKSVAYGNLTAVLVEAVKQQQKQIAELRAALEELNSDKNS